MRKTPRAISLRSVLVVASLGLVFAAGIFHAASQYFRAVDYWMKNSRLKKQIDELQAEKRRLLLAKEIAMSPGEIGRAARRLGVVRPPSQDAEAERASVKDSVQDAPNRRSSAENSPEGNPFVIKTTSTKPASREVDDDQERKESVRTKK